VAELYGLILRGLGLLSDGEADGPIRTLNPLPTPVADSLMMTTTTTTMMMMMMMTTTTMMMMI
jgi:hypothetical protein